MIVQMISAEQQQSAKPVMCLVNVKKPHTGQSKRFSRIPSTASYYMHHQTVIFSQQKRPAAGQVSDCQEALQVSAGHNASTGNLKPTAFAYLRATGSQVNGAKIAIKASIANLMTSKETCHWAGLFLLELFHPGISAAVCVPSPSAASYRQLPAASAPATDQCHHHRFGAAAWLLFLPEQVLPPREFHNSQRTHRVFPQ